MSKLNTALSAGRPSARSNKAAMLARLADDAGVKRVNFELSTEQHARLKIYAAKQGKSIKELLTYYIEGLVDN